MLTRFRSKLGCAALLGASSCFAGCGKPLDSDGFRSLPNVAVVTPLPAAYCEIMVTGVGMLDMESDYLPHVISCENGGAGLEALKAQAIAARSVAYYGIAVNGEICDGQGCQVYTCNNPPTAEAHAAVDATRGMYLSYSDTLTYAFYVAGDPQAAGPSCRGASGATESWVTYNEGLAGAEVVQTELGWMHDPSDFEYGQNRGCKSQWSARCLENELGYSADSILRFFYGSDIQVLQAPGDCVADTSTGTTDDDTSSTSEDSSSENGTTDVSDTSSTSEDSSSENGTTDNGTSTPATSGGSDDDGAHASGCGIQPSHASCPGGSPCRHGEWPAWVAFAWVIRVRFRHVPSRHVPSPRVPSQRVPSRHVPSPRA